MPSFPVAPHGQSQAVAGWLGVVQFASTQPIRFTSEDIKIDQGVKVLPDIHAGARVPTVFNYEFIVPTGNLIFPLVCPSTQRISYGVGITPSADMITLLRRAIQPYESSGAYPPTPPPILDTSLTIWRGDIIKDVLNPWCDMIKVSAGAGKGVDVTLTVKGTYGEYLSATTSSPPPVLGTYRQIFFNELAWDADNFLSIFTSMTGSGYVFAPRDFSVTVNNSLQNDNSYNDENPQSLRGFFYGMQDISAEMTFLGGADPIRGGTQDGYDSPLLLDNGNEEFDLGGVYKLKNGLWETKTINVPGVSDMAVTSCTFKGMAGSDNGIFCIVPGSMLGG